MPAQLIGVWILHTPNLDPAIALSGIINGEVQLTLTATTWKFQGINNKVWGDLPFFGGAVVNGKEFDIFNGSGCGKYLPGGGVGRYTWTLTRGVLHFTPYVGKGYYGDPCSHFELQNTSYIRAS